MASIKLAVVFYALFVSDGSSTEVNINFATDPIGFAVPDSANVLSSLWSSLSTAVPTSQLSCSLGIGSASYSAPTKTLTVTLSGSGTSGNTYLISGLAEY